MTNGDAIDPLDAYMASLSCDVSDAAPTTAEARFAARAYRARQSAPTVITTAPTLIARNRRFARLQELLFETHESSYFSDEMMQQRSPALFHLHLGQYLNVASRTQRAPMGADGVSLSAFLMETCDRQVMEARRVAEQQTWGHYHSVDDHQDHDQEEEEEEDDDDEEKEADLSLAERRAQLIELMSQRFVDGADGDYVDYAIIDGDEALDDMQQVQRDAEDRYFADDD